KTPPARTSSPSVAPEGKQPRRRDGVRTPGPWRASSPSRQRLASLHGPLPRCPSQAAQMVSLAERPDAALFGQPLVSAAPDPFSLRRYRPCRGPQWKDAPVVATQGIIIIG